MKITRRMEWPEPRNLVSLGELSEYCLLLYQHLTEESALRAVELDVPYTDGYNIILGHEAGISMAISLDDTEGVYNIFLGHQAGYSNTTGYKNTGINYQALYSNTTGYGNVAIGPGSLDANTEGFDNVAIGVDALGANTTADYNIAIGTNALKSNTDQNENIGIGYNTLADSTGGFRNTAIGSQAMGNTTTGDWNVAISPEALLTNTTGSTNIAIGSGALYSLQTTSTNTAIGHKAGYLCTGTGNVFLGYYAGGTLTDVDDKLVIARNSTVTPLIYGEFNTNLICINDNANTKMTAGITIQQGAADDEILALKSSDVAHGITDYAETDTYGAFMKEAATTGGMTIRGYGSNKWGIILSSMYTTDDTTKDATGRAPVEIHSWKKSGTGIDVQGADANTFVIKSGTGTRFIVDEDGDILYDGTAGAYQDYDDIALLAELEDVLSGKTEGSKIKDKNICKEKIVHESKFVSTKKKNMLLYGAIRQMNKRIEALEAR